MDIKNRTTCISQFPSHRYYTVIFDSGTNAEQAAAMAKSDGCDYFKRTSLFWIVSVILGMGHFTWVVFAPETFPFEHLGPYGSFCSYLVDNYADIMYKGWWAAWVIHVFEAFVALRVCSNKGINNPTTRFLWVFQTFLFGFASLGLLLKYDPERPKQH